MTNLFPVATPEAVGIASEWLQNFLTRLEEQQIPLHSAIVMRSQKVCMETYYQPYTRETLHRMFSVTKSFVSLAVGLLEAEGRLSLSDPIVDYFPEKQPDGGPFEYTKMMTIQDMLAMTSCHDRTTYKAEGVTDWVGSFFTTPPSHVPGTNFSYDTSATHVLGALVEKLAGCSLLDYLRRKCLDEIGFSADAFMLKDPNGVSMGGSGLCAKPYDLLRTIALLAGDGAYNGRRLLPKAYLDAARTQKSDPFGKQSTLEELQGYGYQIWMTQHGGYAFFGMGGQLAVHVPDKELILVTTADTQGRQGGVQLIYDAFWEEIYSKITTGCLPEAPAEYERLQAFTASRCLAAVPGFINSPAADLINGVPYVCDENSCGVKQVTLQLDDPCETGSLTYINATGTHTLSFGIGSNKVGLFPDYHLKYAASGAWRMDSYFLIRVQIIDTAVGSIYIGLNFKGDYITVMFRKIEESLFEEYDGVFSGKKQS